MSLSIVPSAADAGAADRWRIWRLAYDDSSRKAAMQMRLLFALAVIVLAGVVTFQLLT